MSVINISSNITKQSFDALIIEFKEKRENIISILKIVLEQRKVEEFKPLLARRKDENQLQMRAFIKSKYWEFIESVKNINECRQLTKAVEDSLNSLETNLQAFLSSFSENYLDRMKEKEDLKALKQEKETLKRTRFLFAYINKAQLELRQQKFESAIQMLNFAEEKFIKSFPIYSIVYKRGSEIIKQMKGEITQFIESGLTKWLIDLNEEQSALGESLFKKTKSEIEKKERQEALLGKYDREKHKKSLTASSLPSRETKSIKDSLNLMRTSNLNFMMNKSSLIKNSILGKTETTEEYDIIQMVSNVDLHFLEYSYNIYKKVEIDSKLIEHFRGFRNTQLKQSASLTNKLTDDKALSYERYFSDIVGGIIIQIAVYEIFPQFYNKTKFEENIYLLSNEIVMNLSVGILI